MCCLDHLQSEFPIKNLLSQTIKETQRQLLIISLVCENGPIQCSAVWCVILCVMGGITTSTKEEEGTNQNIQSFSPSFSFPLKKCQFFRRRWSSRRQKEGSSQEKTSEVIKRKHLFSAGETSCTIKGVPQHQPVVKLSTCPFDHTSKTPKKVTPLVMDGNTSSKTT